MLRQKRYAKDDMLSKHAIASASAPQTEELDRASTALRASWNVHRRVALVIGNSGDRAWGLLDTARQTMRQGH